VSRALLCAGLAAFVAVGAGPARDGIRIGGTPLQLLAARGSLWVLTCDSRCAGRSSVGRIVRVDPASARIVSSATIARPYAFAVGAGGVYAIDFWRDTVRRLDPETLRVTSVLKLTLPFRFTVRDNAFLPLAVAPGPRAVWIATERCALARADSSARRVVATVRMPCDATGGIAADARGAWVSESLLGVYRIDPGTNRVVARIQVGRGVLRLDVEHILPVRDGVLVSGPWASGSSLTGENGLARIDPARNRARAVATLPRGPLAVTLGGGSVWAGRIGGSSLQAVDPSTGAVAHVRAHVGVALAVARGGVWTVTRDGILRRLADA